jgi:hypothetical protein
MKVGTKQLGVHESNHPIGACNGGLPPSKLRLPPARRYQLSTKHYQLSIPRTSTNFNQLGLNLAKSGLKFKTISVASQAAAPRQPNPSHSRRSLSDLFGPNTRGGEYLTFPTLCVLCRL